MLKFNSLIKKFNKLLISRIELIGSFFSRLKTLFNFKSKKKNTLTKIDKQVSLSIGILIILFLSYFLIPTLYEKNLVKSELESQILKKYNLEVNIEGDVNYGLFPKPHFFIKDINLRYKGNKFAKTNSSKIFISMENFFSLESLEIKDTFFKKTEFNINSKNFKFFNDILNKDDINHELNFEDSILFYKDKDEDVIFFTEINKLKLFYNENNNRQLDVKFKIYNIPFYYTLEKNIIEKKIFSKLKSQKLRLNIKNIFDYNNTQKEGFMELDIITKSKEFRYIIKENSLNFNSLDDSLKGNVDFKPFYFLSDLSFNQLDMKNAFKNDSILINLLNSEILNNHNLNAMININFKKIKGVNYLKNVNLRTYFEESKIIIKNSSMDWNDSVSINLEDIEIVNEDNKLNLFGSVIFHFSDLNKFYNYYQIKKSYRKKIKNIRFDFLLDVNQRNIQLDNLKVDGSSYKSIDDFIDNLNTSKIDVSNKVIYRNSIKDFFAKYYEG